MLERSTADTPDPREIIEWLLPFATYPECVCDKGTVGECDCNVEEAQRNYQPTIEKAQAFLSGGSGEVPAGLTPGLEIVSKEGLALAHYIVRGKVPVTLLPHFESAKAKLRAALHSGPCTAIGDVHGRTIPLDQKTHYELSLERQLEGLRGEVEEVLDAIGSAAVVHLTDPGPIRLIPEEWHAIEAAAMKLCAALRGQGED